MGALSGSKASPEAPVGLRPSGYDPERVRVDGSARQASMVAERWKKQYCRDGRWGSTISGPAEETYAKIVALGPTPTAADLETIGLRIWATERCDLCDAHPDVWLEVGEEPDYEARWLYMCLPCAEHLGAIAMETRRAETTVSAAKP